MKEERDNNNNEENIDKEYGGRHIDSLNTYNLKALLIKTGW